MEIILFNRQDARVAKEEEKMKKYLMHPLTMVGCLKLKTSAWMKIFPTFCFSY